MKIKDLDSNTLNHLIQLECDNILPILASVGINLGPEDMRKQMDFFKESEVVISQSEGQIDGFVMYEVKGSEVTVISFNLKTFNSLRVLSHLLREIFENLHSTPIHIITSHAHHTNKKSLNFHRRMGFKEVGSNEHLVEFQANKDDLMATITRRVKI